MSAPRRRVVPIAAIVAFIGCGALGFRVSLDDDITRMLPDSDPRLTQAFEIMRGILDRTAVDISVDSDDAPSAEKLGTIADRFATELTNRVEVAGVRTRFGTGDLLEVIDLLRDRAPALLTESAFAEIESRTTEASMRERLLLLAQQLQEPDDMFAKRSAPRDPLGLTDLALGPLESLTAGFRDAQAVDGRILSSDGQHVLAFVEPGFDASESDRTTEYLEAFDAAVAAVRSESELRDARIRHVGTHRATAENAAMVKRDVAVTSSVGITAVTILALLCFGRIWLSLLALTPAIYGSIIALGVFALFEDTLTGAAIGFGAVLLGLTIDFAVHVLFRLAAKGPQPIEARPARWRLLDVFGSRVGTRELPVRALSMGAVTTSAAFLALLSSSLPGLRDIGVFGSIGILGAGLFALTLLPWFGARLAPRAQPKLDLRRVALRWVRPNARVVAACLAITPLLAIGTCSVRFDGDPNRLSGMTAAAIEDEAVLSSTWGEAFRTTLLAIQDADLQSALAANDLVAAELARLKSEGAIRDYSSIHVALPSRATQLRRIARWQEFWTDRRRATLETTFGRVAEEIGFDSRQFSPFFEWLSRPPAPIEHGDAQLDEFGPLVRARGVDDGWLVTTQVFVDEWDQYLALDDSIRATVPEAIVLNRTALVRQFGEMVGDEIVQLGLIALLSVAVIVFLWLGRLELTAVIVLPLLLSLVWCVGLLGLFNVPLTLPNSIFVVFLFGVAVDYSIFLTVSRVERFQTGVDRVVEAHASVLLCAITTCIGFGSLVFAQHPVMHTIGVTALIGLLSAAIATQVFVPVLAGGLLREHGPNGSPGVHNIYAAAWAFCNLALPSLWYRLTRTGPRGSHDRAIGAIAKLARRVRSSLPIGRRAYVDATGKPLERMPIDRPCVIVSNHESIYDVMALLALPLPGQILVKDWVWNAPIIGPMVRRAGYTLVTEDRHEEMLAQIKAGFDRGVSLIVFPEGTRSRNGKIGRFRNGAFAIARSLGVPVLPVALVGTREVVPVHAWWVGHHDVRVAILDPVDPAEFSGEGGDRRMARAVRDRVRDCRRALWPETQFGSNWHRPLAGLYRYFGPVLSQYALFKYRLDPLLRALPSLCAGDGPILVAGCGHGLMTSRLAAAFPEREITAIDLDEHKLRVAERVLGDRCNVRFVLGDITDVDIGSCEFVLLADVLHYWPAGRQRELLSSLADRVQPGTTLVFRDGCAGTRGHRWLRRTEAFSQWIGFTARHGEMTFHAEDGWKELLRDVGFTVARSHAELASMSNVVLTCHRS